jgi:hypothetical protein
MNTRKKHRLHAQAIVKENPALGSASLFVGE